MSPKPTLTLDDLPPEARREVLTRAGRKKRPYRRTLTADNERSLALEALAEMSALSRDQRRRVLLRALKINAV